MDVWKCIAGILVFSIKILYYTAANKVNQQQCETLDILGKHCVYILSGHHLCLATHSVWQPSLVSACVVFLVLIFYLCFFTSLFFSFFRFSISGCLKPMLFFYFPSSHCYFSSLVAFGFTIFLTLFAFSNSFSKI
ncbi:hypothetical protein V8G54_026976 [Vigna mungo]|uniref:Uncharacterized protein n=1 Tax=Vigna mungo TaxID=3915 RepID=A0AAQ3N1N7_VIGMU